MSTNADLQEYPVSPDDPLASEHRAVSAWVEASMERLPKGYFSSDIELKTVPEGQLLLEGKPDQSLRYVRAALIQMRHWQEVAERLTAEVAEKRRGARQVHSELMEAQKRSRQAVVVITSLTRRALPFERDDLLAFLKPCIGTDENMIYTLPSSALTRALEKYAAQAPLDDELRAKARSFTDRLRASLLPAHKTCATTLQRLLATGDASASIAEPPEPAEVRPAPKPAPAGNPNILVALKQLLDMQPPTDAAQGESFGRDRFPLSPDSPLRREHELIKDFLDDFGPTRFAYSPSLELSRSGRVLGSQDSERTGMLILAAAERHVHALLGLSADPDYSPSWEMRRALEALAPLLLKLHFELDRAGLFDVLLFLAIIVPSRRGGTETAILKLVDQVETEAEQSPLTEGERYVLSLFRTSQIIGPAMGTPPPEVTKLTRLIGDGMNFYLTPGEVWSDAVNVDLTALPAAKSQAWAALFKHAMTATSSRPSAKWLATGGKLVEAIGKDEAQDALLRWFPLVSRGRSVTKLSQYQGDARGGADVMNDENANALRGLLWLTQTLKTSQPLTRAITAVALSAYKKVPGVGPRAVKVGNAAVYALSEMKSADAVGQLAMLKVRVKFGTAQKEIEKAFNTAAEALGLPRDQIEEMGVPSYGMEEVGRRVETLGDCRAEISVNGSDAEIQWFDAKGKPVKSVPAKVTQDHKDDLKEIQQAVKDIQAMLPAQRDRLDGMFLLQKSWPFEGWRDRYLDHPLIGTIARRLIWRVDGKAFTAADGAPADLEGKAIEPGAGAAVTPWHPVECGMDEILAWRRRLEELQVTQPFKQAHREIYLLTDAERNTRTYSNRFAAHVLRQHQFNALCAARGWKNRLRLMVDDSYEPPTKLLPQWGLRAEYWVEGIGDNYGTDTNETGVFLRLAADQVRFYRTEAAANRAHAGGGNYTAAAAGPGLGNINEPLPLDEVPPLVFSEIMRDVDLFVGVASVGNDPTWQDGGPGGRYREYWQSYSFGELSGTAATRKQVLERLVPRLKIAGRCSFADRFLVVRGDLRTYKIHLGSGNILMEPNDQYLCIVPDARAKTKQEDLFLPFEGDNTLSIIISKAFLLAADTKITDPTITRQIR